MTSLHHEIVGADNDSIPPLYCIHTVPLDLNYFKSSLEGIEPDFKIILVDLPGHGKSEDPEGEEISFADMASNINKLREELGHETISILGHGVGGFIAMEYALEFEENTEKLLLLNTAPNNKYREVMAWNIREQYSKVTIQALEQHMGKTDEKSLRIRFTQSLATYFSPPDHEMAKQLMDNADRIGTDTYVYISRYLLPNVNYRERLRGLSMPVLVMSCTEDVWPESSSQLIRNDIIHAKFYEFETGHFPMIVRGEEFWNKIIDFVTG